MDSSRVLFSSGWAPLPRTPARACTLSLSGKICIESERTQNSEDMGMAFYVGRLVLWFVLDRYPEGNKEGRKKVCLFWLVELSLSDSEREYSIRFEMLEWDWTNINHPTLLLLFCCTLELNKPTDLVAKISIFLMRLVKLVCNFEIEAFLNF